MEIILASASPRRQELLRRLFETFTVAPADVDESVPTDMSAAAVPAYLAEKKAAKAAREHSGALIIAADTVVLAGDTILGKPQNKAEAAQMLRTLSGETHRVLTGCCLARDDKRRTFTVESRVTFYPLSESDIGTYIQSGEPMDKAGAYAIQGKGAFFVKGIEGDYYNIVGLPIAELKRQLTLWRNDDETSD